MKYLMALALMYPATVRDMGYCADVSSQSCPVQGYWPSHDITGMVGTGTYWLLSTDGRVCFVSEKQYIAATIGVPFDCGWRRRNP